jgi:lauroyl/myristoyl acyltransferase
VAEAPAEAGRWLRRAESLAYWTAIAPVAACLPAPVAYGVAVRRGDLVRRLWPQKRAELVRDLRQVLGDGVGEDEVQRLAREIFRYRSCEIMDLMRLRGRARPLIRLVDIQGREHLEAALAGGKGAILCTGHFGSHQSSFSVLSAIGYPVTTIGRWDWKYDTTVSPAERRFWDLAFSRRVVRHRRRPHLEPWPGRLTTAVQAAAALRENEFVTICSDAGPLAADQPRSLEMPFLGQQARLLPGVVSIAKLTGAPVLMVFIHRSADYRHQTLEISPPVSMQGDTATAFERVVAAIDGAIQANPASWNLWFETEVLARLGLVQATPAAAPAGPAAPAAAGADELQGSRG